MNANGTLRGLRGRILFLGLLLVYNANLRPVASGDSLGAALTPFAVLLDGTPRLDRFAPHINANVWYAGSVLRESGGHWYSVYPIAGPVLTVPLYAPLLLAPGIRELPPATLVSLARIVEKPVASLLAAFAALLGLLVLQRLTPPRVAWAGAWIFALATGAWSTASQALWQHTYGLPLILGVFYSLIRLAEAPGEGRWAWTAGVCAGLAVAVRPTSAALLPALAVALAMQRPGFSNWVRVAVPVTLSCAGLTAWNLSVFGRITGGYPPTLDANAWHGALGLLFSPGRGLFVYTPLAALALMAGLPSLRRPVVAAAACFCVGHLALAACWPIWWGGYCWGPRLLTELLPALLVLGAFAWPNVRRGRSVFAAAAAYGVLIQILGVFYYPKGRWDHLPNPVDTHPERLWDVRDNPIARTAAGGLAWEPFAVVEAAIRGGVPAARERLKELGIQPQ